MEVILRFTIQRVSPFKSNLTNKSLYLKKELQEEKLPYNKRTTNNQVLLMIGEAEMMIMQCIILLFKRLN